MESSSFTAAPRAPRRAVLGLALGGLAALAGLGSVVAKPKRAKPGRKPRPKPRPKPRFKVVNRTFHNPSAIMINDKAPASPYPSLLTVAGLKHGKVLDLSVTLFGFSHEVPNDVDLLLVAPNGRGAVIMSDVGGSFEVNNLTVVLDDQADAPLSSDPLVSGRFRPQNAAIFGEEADPFPAPAAFTPYVALATFNGINPNGTWKLFVVDDVGGDVGFILGGWSLTIKARVRT